MNKLELVQALHYEAGVQGSAPTDLDDLTGTAADLDRWTDRAYQSIQAEHDTWAFLRYDFSVSTVAATQSYSLTDLALTELLRWKVDDVRIYSAVADETYLQYLPWKQFRETYLFGSSRSQSDRPIIFSIKPDKSIIFYATPDAVYTVNGEYWKRPQSLSDAESEPLFNHNQMAIVWRALMFYGADVGADDLYSHGKIEYKRELQALERSELPPMTWGEPLA